MSDQLVCFWLMLLVLR